MHYTLYNIVIGGTLKRAFFVNLTIKSAAKKMNIVSVAIISQSYMELSIAHNGIHYQHRISNKICIRYNMKVLRVGIRKYVLTK